ncbi:M60 family metallopeptidase [Vibrio aestuarianus]|uniref:M60 family metallopeptidase n=1 Tax=Vibrio aestuarianus TaxID=28171 RepID=A0ABD7YKJ1_9VIBR|nr:M60 family metallopeptidase [Vibrio aestuarianus]WGK85151.1 M60 family metallopeptidase [Vibrio aestuarianus]
MMKKNLISQSILLAIFFTTITSVKAAEPSREVTVEQRYSPERFVEEQRRPNLTHPVQSSGFWAKKGDELVINYNYDGANLKDKPQIWIVPIQYRDEANLSPQKITIEAGNNRINVKESGVIYYAPMSPESDLSLTFNILSGGREMPRFILNEDSDDDWQEMLSRYNTAPYGELVGKRMIITLPMTHMNKITNPTEIMSTWDHIVNLTEEQYGLGDNNNPPHSATKLQYLFQSKPNNTGGYMSASSYWLGANESGFNDVTTKISNSWGPWHELGHHYQLPFMTWDGLGEVTVNLTSLYVQRALGHSSRLIWSNVFSFVNSHQAYDECRDLFVKVAMFWQLDLTFGQDFYARLGNRIRTMPTSELPLTNDDKKQLFILESSRVSGFDLTPFFETWGLSATQETKQKLQALNLTTLDKPIWQNTDQNKPFTYPLSQQNINTELVLPKVIAPGETFTVTANVTNRNRSDTLSYQFHTPEGFELIESQGNAAVFKAPQHGLLHNSIVIVKVDVSDGKTQFPAASGARIALPNLHQSHASYSDDIIKKQFGIDDLKAWDFRDSVWGDRQTAHVDDIYKHVRSTGIYYYQLTKSPYYYFPSESQVDNSYWKKIAHTDLRTHYAKTDVPIVEHTEANAGADIQAQFVENQFYYLNGSNSTGENLDFKWTIKTVEGVAREAIVLRENRTETPKIKIKIKKGFEVSDSISITVKLLVQDESGKKDSDTVILTLRTDTNHAPEANARVNVSTVEHRASFILNGSQSTDVDGDTLTYHWTQTAGKPIALGDTSQARITVNTESLENRDQTLTFALTVNDGTTSDTANVSVNVTAINTGGGDYDYVYPNGFGSYGNGTVVKFQGHGVYQCFGSWSTHCNNASFLPGHAADPNWVNQQWKYLHN